MTAPEAPPQVGSQITVRVGDPVAGGACLSRLDGQVIFVTGGLPNELVSASVTGSGRNGGFLRAEVVDVLEPSGHRVEPPCSIASECGGCDWQHSEFGYQRELKARVICDALQRTGGVTEIAGIRLADAVTVEPLDDGDGLGWRSRMRYAIDDDGAVGLRAARSHRIIPAADCPLALPDLANEVPEQVTNFGTERALVAVETSEGEIELGTTRTHRTLTERVLDRTFNVDLNGFWQVHPAAPGALVGAVLEFANPQPGEIGLDLYSGVGLFATFLGLAVEELGRVDAVEGDVGAVELAKRNTADLPWIHHHDSDISKWLRRNAESSKACGFVVLDPPRAGLKHVVVELVAAARPSRIVYVACDPAALARDTKLFAQNGYTLAGLRAFDLFPMTKHVECVALFVLSTDVAIGSMSSA